MAALGVGTCCYSSPSWECEPSATTSLRCSGFHRGIRSQGMQEHLQEEIVSNTRVCLGNRLKLSSNWDSATSRKLVKQFSWLNSQHSDKYLGSQLCNLDAQKPRESRQFRCTGSSGLGETPTLCGKGQLEMVVDAMDQPRTAPSVSLCRSLLNACIKRKALAQAKRVHAHIAKHGLESDTFLGEYLVITLVKCGGLDDALQVFRRLPRHTVFSWTAVISGYTLAGQCWEALKLYKRMQLEGVQPNAYTFVSLLKACGSIADVEEGKRIHGELLKYRYESNVFVGNCLIDMYGKCGSIVDARSVFDALSNRDVVSWNSLLAAYVQRGLAEQALELFGEMQEQGESPNDRTFVSILQACCVLAQEEGCMSLFASPTRMKAFGTGRLIHAFASTKGYGLHAYVANTLICMYGKCGTVGDAQHVFDGMDDCKAVSWTALISAYVELGQEEKALQLYEYMRGDGVAPDAQTFLSVLQACSVLGEKEGCSVLKGACMKVQSLQQAKAIHADAQATESCSDVFVGSILVSTYGKCGSLKDAQHVFDGLPRVDVVGWTAMLAAYTQQGEAEKALQMYESMREKNVSPDARTFVAALQACCMIAELQDDATQAKVWEKGKAIHADAQRKGYASDVFVSNTLISMYGKCGSIDDAWRVFQDFPHADVVSWNAIIVACVQQGEAERALRLYNQMQKKGMCPDEVTLVCMLQACSNLGNLEMLRKCHHVLVSTRNVFSLLLANTLIHAYGKCASMRDAQSVFDALPQPDVVSWNSLIAGYARQGDSVASLQCYEKMLVSGVTPSEITFLSLLSACSHSGRVDEGIEYFESMSKDYGITPGMAHVVSMLDLLGRVGCFSRIIDLLMELPEQSDLALWLCVLGACRKHGAVELAKRAFDHAVQLQPRHAATYVVMSNIYADAGLLDCATNTMMLGETRNAWRKSDPSMEQVWIELDQETHSFSVGDCTHLQHENLYAMLQNASLSSRLDSPHKHLVA